MQTLNAELLASRSATQTLEKLCADHRLTDASSQADNCYLPAADTGVNRLLETSCWCFLRRSSAQEERALTRMSR